MIGVANPGALSLGQWQAIRAGWNAHHDGGRTIAPPSAAEFDAAVGDLKATMDKLGVANPEQKELLAIIESTRPQITEKR